MRSEKKLKTYEVKVSSSNIQAWIEAGLRQMKVIPDSRDVLSIKLDYAGGYISPDKIIPVEIITKKEVQVIDFGKN